MPEEILETPPSTPPAPPAEKQATGDDAGTGKLYTEADMTRKLRGTSSELKKAHERLAEFEKQAEEQKRAELEKQGQYKQLLGTTQTELDAVKARLAELLEQDEKRTTAAQARNTSRIQALSDSGKAIADKATGLPPDALSELLDQLERADSDSMARGVAASTGASVGGQLTPEEADLQLRQDILDAQMGKKRKTR